MSPRVSWTLPNARVADDPQLPEETGGSQKKGLAATLGQNPPPKVHPPPTLGRKLPPPFG